MKMAFLAIGTAPLIVLATTLAAHGAGGKTSKYTGCLAQGDEAKEFKLTNVNGGSEEYELIGGKGLKDHVGHKVEISGRSMSSKSAEKAEGGEKAEKGAAESAHQHLRVVSMKHLAATCP